MNERNKYSWLTKEILEKDYIELGNFKAIALKYDIPRSTIERYCKLFEVKTKSKKSYSCYNDLFSLDTEASFYLAGFIAADGCILQHKSKEPNCLSICLSKKDEDHLASIAKILQFNGPISHSISRHSNKNKNWNDCWQSRISIYSKTIITDLKRFGIGQRKSLVYVMPNWLIKHPMINHFLRGYIDGDGSFYVIKENRKTKNKGIRIYSKLGFSVRGTNIFCRQLKTILEDNSICTKSAPQFNNGIDQLKYSGNKQVLKIAKFLYTKANYMLYRKFDVVKGLL